MRSNRRLVRFSRVTAVLAVLLSCLFSPAWSGPTPEREPDGWGKARFGMSREEVGRLFPHAQPLSKEHLGAAAPLGPEFARQLLPEEKFPGLELPVSVELRYFRDRLYAVVVYWGANPAERVLDVLRRRYGPAPGPEPTWKGEKVTIATDVRGRWHAFWDNRLSQEAARVFTERLSGRSAPSSLEPRPSPKAVPTGEGP
ncbi:MAG: hypothetical protein KatS3mg076_1659 [Candidatus Binatia bacterium]|nr:MAG: hypothetical protein KatS3mg076_1659 [Candidatus Binatia bacterium]